MPKNVCSQDMETWKRLKWIQIIHSSPLSYFYGQNVLCSIPMYFLILYDLFCASGAQMFC